MDCSEKFQIIDRKNVESIVESSMNNNPNFHLLTYKNKEAKDVNDWIKKSIIKNGEELAPGDLIIFENTFQIADINDPFSNPKKSTMVNLERLQKSKHFHRNYKFKSAKCNQFNI